MSWALVATKMKSMSLAGVASTGVYTAVRGGARQQAPDADLSLAVMAAFPKTQSSGTIRRQIKLGRTAYKPWIRVVQGHPLS